LFDYEKEKYIKTYKLPNLTYENYKNILLIIAFKLDSIHDFKDSRANPKIKNSSKIKNQYENEDNDVNINEQNNFIFGSRYMKTAGSDDDSLLTYIGNKIFTFMGRNLLKIKLSDVLYTYVMCDVKIFRRLKFNSRDFRFCIELPFQIEKNKYNYSEIPAMERKRFDGKKNVSEFKDGFLILLEIIRNIFIK
jgi:hypothetical protein